MTTAAQPKRRGRPPGTGLPPEQRRSATIRVRATADELRLFERLGGAEWLRERLAEYRPSGWRQR